MVKFIRTIENWLERTMFIYKSKTDLKENPFKNHLRVMDCLIFLERPLVLEASGET